MTDAERAKRYRIRQQLKAQAQLAGGTEIELGWFGVNADGYHVAFDSNGSRIDLVPIPRVEVLKRTRDGVYPPKDMPKDQYERVVKLIRDKGLTKAQAIDQLGNSSDQKLGKRMIALVQHLPEGPDWADNFPEYE